MQKNKTKTLIIVSTISFFVVALLLLHFFVFRCEHRFNEGVIEQQATCGKVGKILYSCSNCSFVKKSEIPATEEHVFEEKITKAATCINNGEKTLTCKNCEFKKTQLLDLTSHTYEFKITTEPSCTKKGIQTEFCTICHVTGSSTEVDVAPHAFVKSSTLATCTAKGLDTYTCSDCGYSYSEEIPIASHQWSEWKVITEATFETQGSRTRNCSACSKSQTEVIPVRTLTKEEKYQQALQVANEIVATIDKDATPIDKISFAAQAVSQYCAKATYTTSGSDYCEAYGVFVKGEFSCAGATRALGMLLDCMGFEWNHINENQWTHQWCQVFVNGEEYWADGQIGLAGFGKHPFV